MIRFLLVMIAVLVSSTAVPLIHYSAPAPALTVAALRVSLAGLLLSIAAPHAWLLLLRLSARERISLVLSGVLLGAHFGVWVTLPLTL